MKKKILLAILMITSVLLLASCGRGGDVYEPSYPNDMEYSDEVLPDKDGSLGTGDSLVDADHKIIKTVYETVETESYDEFIEGLREAVTAAGGYISSSNYSGGGIYSTQANRRATFEMRIPAERLGNFTGTVEGLGAVTYYEESARDVTLTYVDVTSKISVLEAEEAALLSILANAKTTSEILAIRNSLSEVQGDLASLRAQKNVIDDRVAYSTVNLTLREVKRVSVAEPGFFEEIGDEFSDSLDDLGDGFRAFFVWLIGDSLYILLVGAIAVGVFFILRGVIRRIKATRVNKKVGKEQKTEK